MNLEQSDSFKSDLEKNARSKRNVMISIVLCAFLIALLFMMIVLLQYQDSITEKMFLDDTQIAIPKNFYKTVDGERYVNIKELGTLLGYTYTEGLYGVYDEEHKDSCYLQNNFEILTVTAGSQKFTKYLELSSDKVTMGNLKKITLKNEEGYSENFKIEKPVIYEDEILYAPQEYISQMFNIQVDWQEYRINFYTLNYLVNVAQKVVAKAGLTEMSGYYENIRALNYGYIIVGNSTDKTASDLFGVISLNDGSEIISKKYDDIVFVENSEEFSITAGNGTVGILNHEGKTVIAPSEFEAISLMDQENKLYLVEKANEYGVLDRNGKIVVYAENDEVGIDTSSFTSEEIDNNCLFFEKCIPVEKEGKYGLYDIKGNLVLDKIYDGFGYKTRSKVTSSGSEQSVLLIPSYVGINGIVVNLNDAYGIYDINAESLILPTVFEKIYSITESGQKTYYVYYNGQEIDLAQFLKENNLNNVDESGKLLSESDNEVQPSGEETPEETTEGNSNETSPENSSETNQPQNTTEQ